MKTKQEDEAQAESAQYSRIQLGRGKLKLTKNSKDKDKKRLKKEKRRKRKEEFSTLEKEELQNSAQVATRRRFENQSGKRDCAELSKGKFNLGGGASCPGERGSSCSRLRFCANE